MTGATRGHKTYCRQFHEIPSGARWRSYNDSERLLMGNLDGVILRELHMSSACEGRALDSGENNWQRIRPTRSPPVVELHHIL